MSVMSPISPWSQDGRDSLESDRSPAETDIPMRAGPQFQTVPGELSNLDRCNWCGTPRSAHGIDWSCPSRNARNGRHLVALVVAGGVLALAGVALLAASSQTASSLGSLGAAGFLAGLVVLICIGTIAGRRG